MRLAIGQKVRKSDCCAVFLDTRLGVPETEVSLGEKVIYKYSDMAVEFVDGKVADVKF